jgi:hypothetical protein
MGQTRTLRIAVELDRMVGAADQRASCRVGRP